VYIRRFQQVYDLIADHPLIGALHRTVRHPIHSLPCGSHRVYYDVMDDRAVV
jgi:plasmid stabilization system protein ParE